MTARPSAQLNLAASISESAHMAKPKTVSSSTSRRRPGTAIGAAPERLGSCGTAKTPYRTAAIRGIAIASTKRHPPSPCRQPHPPIASRADNSSRNRMTRLIGYDPISFRVGQVRGRGDSLGAITHAELAEDIVEMFFDRTNRQFWKAER
jgi:hypothetical protein